MVKLQFRAIPSQAMPFKNQQGKRSDKSENVIWNTGNTMNKIVRAKVTKMINRCLIPQESHD
jgi:hypothetical protein